MPQRKTQKKNHLPEDGESRVYMSVPNGSQIKSAYVWKELQTCTASFTKWFAYCSGDQNLSVFCVNTKRTGYAGCPFHTPGVLCPPQVRGKLINHAPNTRRMQTAQRVSDALVYTRFKTSEIA